VLTLFFAEEKNITEDVRRTLKSYAELIHVALRNVWQSQDSHQVDLLAERQSIANEIHDSLAQTLYFAKIRSSLLLDAMKTNNELLAYKCAQDIDEALENSQKTVRELVTHFRCQMDPRGLIFALQKLVNDFVARTKIVLEYENELEGISLPQEYELQVFLIIRESLVNIATHSGATISRLTVTRNNNEYRFVVEDNGGGVSNDLPSEGHYGMTIMSERALRIGGVVEVESLQGRGTRVQLVFSVPEA
jgi:two-component system, NarL family, nitrate/nitrite sensor histidine kinase NarX